jgi:hypothetical protein
MMLADQVSADNDASAAAVAAAAVSVNSPALPVQCCRSASLPAAWKAACC